ncbi:hypothetical protein [Shewanella gaetbuli]|uniref:Uncharacterized protein n=1 Tax=Shewanella gaetbuli TaxID=220752 RepID=A0A9X1ZIG3_9GAMM|nr:hypothetical protein [Shewanella gaetbuli]MCL1142949.1 hypothetical protein [Shewanella gaetbuli]
MMPIFSHERPCPECDTPTTSYWRGQIERTGDAEFSFDCDKCGTMWDELLECDNDGAFGATPEEDAYDLAG